MIHQDLDSPVLKKVKHQRMLNEGVTKVRTQNPLVITIIRKDILLMFVGTKGSINKAYPKARVIVISATCKEIRLKTTGLMS